MRVETTIIAAYASLVIVVALGLHGLGRSRVSAWTSRALAGHRRAMGHDESASDPTWLAADSQRIHTVVASVAAAAGTLLPAAELFRHHRASEILVLGVVVIAGLITINHLRRGPRSGPQSS